MILASCPDTVELALTLLRAPSPSGEEGIAIDTAADLAERLGFDLRRVPVDERRDNLMISSGGAPKILLTTHLDVVPGGPTPRLQDGVLHGRGACDAKGIAAAMLGALWDLRAREERGVALLLVVGEETCSDGAIAAAQQLDPVEFYINGEPTELQFVRAQRGALAVALRAEGTAAHSGYPELGRSAVHKLLDALERIRSASWPSDPEIGATLVNVGTIHGGQAANVLAPAAQAELMLRVATSAVAVESQLRTLVGVDIAVDIRTRSEPQRLHVPQGRQGVVVGYASDVAHLRPLGTPLMMGPGSIRHAHTDHEHVAVADLESARRGYTELCLELLHRGAP